MIDTFALALSHGLIFLALWRLLGRDDLNGEQGEAAGKARHRRRDVPDA